MLRMMFLVFAVLFLYVCAPKLMPHQVVVQPPSQNEVVKAQHNGKEIYLMVARVGRGDSVAVVVSGPFAVGELDGVVTSGTWQEKFESIRQERSWLLFEFSCGNNTCKATFHHRRRGGQHIEDNWWFLKYHPKLRKADIPGWISQNLAEVGLKTNWSY